MYNVQYIMYHVLSKMYNVSCISQNVKLTSGRYKGAQVKRAF